MKPLYIFLLMWAVFITGLADGISWALLPIPGLGIVLALAITFCINATMGMGLLFLLVSQGMYHPKFGPVGTILGLVPPFNFLPVWVGLVGAGIVQDMSKEKGTLGAVAGVATSLQSGKNPLTTARNLAGTVMNERRRAGRPPQAANDNEPQTEQEEKSRSPLNLKSPSMSMNSDIAPARNHTYAKAA